MIQMMIYYISTYCFQEKMHEICGERANDLIFSNCLVFSQSIQSQFTMNLNILITEYPTANISTFFFHLLFLKQSSRRFKKSRKYTKFKVAIQGSQRTGNTETESNRRDQSN